MQVEVNENGQIVGYTEFSAIEGVSPIHGNTINREDFDPAQFNSIKPTQGLFIVNDIIVVKDIEDGVIPAVEV